MPPGCPGLAVPASVGHRVRMATVVLVQLAIAVLGCCVLAIAAAPALTRPVRALVPSSGDPASGWMSATVRVVSGRVSQRWHELVAVAIVAARSCRVRGARGAGAIRRSGELVVAAVGTRIRNARTLVYRARHARGPLSTALGDTGLGQPERVIDLRDKRSVGYPSYRPRHRA